ncbi:MAG: hypothetical protein E7345_01275 [Clostridiales bacterium]|nr:hypothetical protein [Clostridiales bacterium]
MNKRRLALLKYLLNNCGDKYKIFDTSKLLTINRKYKNNFTLFSEDVKYLKQMNFIDVKYIDEVNVCLLVLGSSIVMQENLKKEHKLAKRDVYIMLFTALLCGITSFIGCVLANILFG